MTELDPRGLPYGYVNEFGCVWLGDTPKVKRMKKAIEIIKEINDKPLLVRCCL